ncbi:MAG: hypothetical protein A3F24_02410 [Candidatus Colwellbacteria bacterium RIFCSPHIGHO2_12_FULL_44_17]|uniref:Uncharacterized protein n=2 Tax=Candidatus Colwelliibacteriota TaxID=1817904 RepID=A0A1G1Z9N7_9BACT|nr:MAG: hypothetical protein A3F24_02410 [Candidatus Colwellbacteria bacterium RIFCSPHIGHO2_12_FULL_44_17]OGY60337.1 MAG: hypothetical protein A3I31_02625 [Candidatus Colwellbacteria bacterium RIFCSPLOWO2_02_FULL_44_20b]
MKKPPRILIIPLSIIVMISVFISISEVRAKSHRDITQATLKVLKEDMVKIQKQHNDVEALYAEKIEKTYSFAEIIHALLPKEQDKTRVINEIKTRYSESAPFSKEQLKVQNDIERELNRGLRELIEKHISLQKDQRINGIHNEIIALESKINRTRHDYNCDLTDYKTRYRKFIAEGFVKLDREERKKIVSTVNEIDPFKLQLYDRLLSEKCSGMCVP